MEEAATIEETLVLEWTTAVEALDSENIKELFDIRPSLLWTPLLPLSHLETDFSHFIQRLKDYKLLGTSIRPLYALNHILFDYGVPDDEWAPERFELVEYILKNTKDNELNTCFWGTEENTVMHLACFLQQNELIQQLKDHGALSTIPNKNGLLPTIPDSQPEVKLLITKPVVSKDRTPATNASDRFKRLRELAESPHANKPTTTERQNSTRRYFRPGHLEERKRRVLSEEEEAELEKKIFIRQKEVDQLAQRSAVKNNPLFKKFEEQKQQKEQEAKRTPSLTAASAVRDRKKLLGAADQIRRTSRVINSLKDRSYVSSSVFRQAQEAEAAANVRSGKSLHVPTLAQLRSGSPVASPNVSDNEEEEEELKDKEDDILVEVTDNQVQIVITETNTDNSIMSDNVSKSEIYKNENSTTSSNLQRDSNDDKRGVTEDELESLAIGRLGDREISSNLKMSKKEIEIASNKVKDIVNVHEHLNDEDEVEIYSVGKKFAVWKKNELGEEDKQSSAQKTSSVKQSVDLTIIDKQISSDKDMASKVQSDVITAENPLSTSVNRNDNEILDKEISKDRQSAKNKSDPLEKQDENQEETASNKKNTAGKESKSPEPSVVKGRVLLANEISATNEKNAAIAIKEKTETSYQYKNISVEKQPISSLVQDTSNTKVEIFGKPLTNIVEKSVDNSRSVKTVNDQTRMKDQSAIIESISTDQSLSTESSQSFSDDDAVSIQNIERSTIPENTSSNDQISTSDKAVNDQKTTEQSIILENVSSNQNATEMTKETSNIRPVFDDSKVNDQNTTEKSIILENISFSSQNTTIKEAYNARSVSDDAKASDQNADKSAILASNSSSNQNAKIKEASSTRSVSNDATVGDQNADKSAILASKLSSNQNETAETKEASNTRSVSDDTRVDDQNADKSTILASSSNQNAKIKEASNNRSVLDDATVDDKKAEKSSILASSSNQNAKIKGVSSNRSVLDDATVDDQNAEKSSILASSSSQHEKDESPLATNYSVFASTPTNETIAKVSSGQYLTKSTYLDNSSDQYSNKLSFKEQTPSEQYFTEDQNISFVSTESGYKNVPNNDSGLSQYDTLELTTNKQSKDSDEQSDAQPDAQSEYLSDYEYDASSFLDNVTFEDDSVTDKFSTAENETSPIPTLTNQVESNEKSINNEPSINIEQDTSSDEEDDYHLVATNTPSIDSTTYYKSNSSSNTYLNTTNTTTQEAPSHVIRLEISTNKSQMVIEEESDEDEATTPTLATFQKKKSIPESSDDEETRHEWKSAYDGLMSDQQEIDFEDDVLVQHNKTINKTNDPSRLSISSDLDETSILQTLSIQNEARLDNWTNKRQSGSQRNHWSTGIQDATMKRESILSKGGESIAASEAGSDQWYDPDDNWNEQEEMRRQSMLVTGFHIPQKDDYTSDYYYNQGREEYNRHSDSSINTNSETYSYKNSNSTENTNLDDDEEDERKHYEPYSQEIIQDQRPLQHDIIEEEDDYYSTNLHVAAAAANKTRGESSYYHGGQSDNEQIEEEGEIVVFMDQFSSPPEHQITNPEDTTASYYNSSARTVETSKPLTNFSASTLSVNNQREDDEISLIKVPSRTVAIAEVGSKQEDVPHDPNNPRVEDISHYMNKLPAFEKNNSESAVRGGSAFDTSAVEGGLENESVVMKRAISTTQQTGQPIEQSRGIPNAHEINSEFNLLVEKRSSQDDRKISMSSLEATNFGKMYIGVSGAHNMLLPLPKEITYVRCVISDGEYEYMSRYEVLGHQILMDYECVIDTRPGMIITVSLHVRPDYHVKPRTGWSRWFTSIRKQKEHLSGYVHPEDGAIGQTRFAVDHMVPGCYKKTYEAHFDCFNSWYARTTRERARREQFGDDEDFLKIVGKLNVEMLYLPVSDPSVQVPRSLRECDLTLKIRQWHDTCWQSGFLSTRRQGLKIWERHYYRLIGSQLIGYTSDGSDRQVWDHYNMSDVIRLSAAADKIIVTLLGDQEDDKVFGYESIHAENHKGFFRLAFPDYHLDCVSDDLEESEEWVKTLKSMIGRVPLRLPFSD